MAEDFIGDRGEKIDKLIAAVIEIRSSLRIMKWFVMIGLPVIVSLTGFAWRDQSRQLSDLERSIGRIEGTTLGAVEPLNTASADINSTTVQLKSTATEMKDAATEVGKAARSISSATEQLSKSLDTLHQRTETLTVRVQIDHTNLTTNYGIFLAKFAMPEGIERHQTIMVYAISDMPPDISFAEAVAVAIEAHSFVVRLVVLPKDGDAFNDFVFIKRQPIIVDVVFISSTD